MKAKQIPSSAKPTTDPTTMPAIAPAWMLPFPEPSDIIGAVLALGGAFEAVVAAEELVADVET